MLRSLFAVILLAFSWAAHAQYTLSIRPPAVQEHAAFANHMRQTDAMSNLVTLINRYVLIDKEVPIVVRSCGRPNAYYYPGQREIVMCYDLMVESQKYLQRAGVSGPALTQSVYAEMAFILLHEVGHHLIHEYDLPVLGKEEDAADKIAAFILLSSSGESVLRRSLSFFANRQRGVLSQVLTGEHDYSASHGLPQQRLANLVCWGYAKSPRDFADMTVTAKVSPDRLRRCDREYEAMERDLTALLGTRLSTSGSGAASRTEPSNKALQSQLATANQCTFCHKPRDYSIGPSLTALAQKYNPEQLESVLARKVRNGSKGEWGQIPAPPMPGVAEDALADLARWVAAHR